MYNKTKIKGILYKILLLSHKLILKAKKINK